MFGNIPYKMKVAHKKPEQIQRRNPYENKKKGIMLARDGATLCGKGACAPTKF